MVAFLLIGLPLFSQTSGGIFKKDSTIQRHELGLDVANVLTFLNRNQQSYLLNYKYHFRYRLSLRFGANFDQSTDKSKGVYEDYRWGTEYHLKFDKWKTYFGVDYSYQYSSSNKQTKYFFRRGISPLIGAKHNFGKHFSVSSEVKFNFYRIYFRDPDSFDPEANYNSDEMFIGSVGMILVNYEFGQKRKKKNLE